MADFTLRPATEDDFPLIKDLIHRVGINPMSLDWHRFVIAVDGSGLGWDTCIFRPATDFGDKPNV